MAFLTEVVVGPGWACLAFEALANDRLHSAVVTAVPDMNQFRCALEFYHWSLRSAVLTFIEVDHLSCSRPNDIVKLHAPERKKIPLAFPFLGANPKPGGRVSLNELLD